MKKLMMTTAASALLFGIAACSQASDDIDMGEADYGETETAETSNGDDMAGTDTSERQMAGTDTSDSYEMVEDAEALGDVSDNPGATDGAENMGEVFLAESELSAEELIGARVVGPNGEDVATVADLLINANGEVETAILKSGDVIDMVGEKVQLPYDQLDVTMAADQEPRFRVSMTEEDVQNATEFEQQGLNDYRLASEMIGTTAGFVNTDDNARIRDIIVNRDGTVQYAVISDPVLMDDLRQLDFGRIQVEQGDGGTIVIDGAQNDVSTMPRFSYEAETQTSGASGTDAMDNEWDDDSVTPDIDTPEVEMEDGTDTTTPQ